MGTAFRAFYRALFNKEFSNQVKELLTHQKPALPAEKPATAAELLAALQREGRFVDFILEQVEGFSDAQVGAVARGVHQGCTKVVSQYLSIERVLSQNEGEKVTVEAGFDPASIRLVGKVEGDPPFEGTLRHHGWRLSSAKLPEVHTGAQGPVLVPAEVEL